MKKRNLILAVAMAMTAGVGVANAAAIVAVTTPTKFSTQEVLKTGFAAGTTTVATIAAVATAPALKVGDTIRVTLTGGAKFDRNIAATTGALLSGTGVFVVATGQVALAFDAAAAVIDATATVYSMKLHATDIEAGAVGIKTATLNNNTAVITFLSNTAGLLDLTGVAAGTPVGLKVEVLSTPALSAANTPQTVTHTGTTTAANSLVTVNPTIESFVAAPASAAKTIDVTTIFKKFKDATVVNQTKAVTSSVSTQFDGSGVAANGYVLFTISGPMAGVTSITAAAGGFSQDSGLKGAAIAAPATPTATGVFFIDTAANKAYASAALGAITPGALTINIDGKTALASSAYTIQADYIQGTNKGYKTHVAIAATELTKWTRDGTSFVLNRMAPQSTIRLSNLSGGTAAGTLTVVAKNAAGTVIANTGLAATVLPTAVASGNTVTISGATLQSDFPAASTFEVSIESDDVLASHRQATPAGLTTTVYRSKAGSGSL